LRTGAGSLLAAGLWPGALRAKDAGHPGDFRFLVVNDVHYLDRRCGPWLSRVIQMMKQPPKPAICLIAGDLVEDGKAEQLGPVRDIFKDLGVPVYVVAGNHDWVSNVDRKPFEKLFPKSINYHFEHAGWQFVGLDSAHGTRAKVDVQPHTLQWLDDTLSKLNK